MLYFLLLEDNVNNTNQYRKLIDFENIFKSTTYATNFEVAQGFLDSPKLPDAFWLDLSLNERKKGGIEILKIIKQKIPNALVVVYTAYPDLEPECKKVGLKNFHFFEKNTSTVEADFSQIRKIFIDFTEKQNSNKLLVKSFTAQIAHIDEEKCITKIEIYNKQNSFISKFFDFSIVKNSLRNDFLLDQWIEIQIWKVENNYLIEFKKKEGKDESINDFIDDLDLRNSEIWG